MRLEEARAVLRLGDTFTAEDLKKRYRLMSLECHPDRNPGEDYLLSLCIRRMQSFFTLLY